jgi:hypothetical protein
MMSQSEWQPPTEQQIRKRAYELYLERQRECGGPLDDWLEAEAELLLKRDLHRDLTPKTA